MLSHVVPPALKANRRNRFRAKQHPRSWLYAAAFATDMERNKGTGFESYVPRTTFLVKVATQNNTQQILAPVNFQRVIDRSDARHPSQRLLRHLLLVKRTNSSRKNDSALCVIHLNTGLLKMWVKVERLRNLSCQCVSIHGESVLGLKGLV